MSLFVTTKHHLTKDLHLTEFQKIIKKLIINLYVDNFTNRFNRVLDAIQFCDQSKIVITDATFILRKWVTNSKRLKILLIINSRSAKLRKVLIEKFLLSF